MAFNLGISNHPISRLGGLSSIGVYLYEDIYYRQWITEIALAFYEGRQDEFIWLDLVRQFRNPEKQQILPINLTREIIDETAVLYREEPIYQVVDDKGKILKKDQALFEEIKEDCRYQMFMDKVDRWTRLLGTVLVKVSFVDPHSGQMVEKSEGGKVQLDILHGGVYDVRHGASPYYITELLIGFGTKFSGFQGQFTARDGITSTVPSPSDYGQSDVQTRQNQVSDISQLGSINRIYWSPNSHKSEDGDGNAYETENPYGIVPAVPFFNQDPAHYYFLPINEPLIYANHALNMRITDLNHIAKFQSFGVPVVKGVERPTSLRQGRAVDDFNVLKGGSAQSKFGGVGNISGFGAGGHFRDFDGGMGIFRDGNADAASLGMTLGPDTAVAVGEKGDFKFAHPSSDIKGLLNTIQSISDMIRLNHGLRPKWTDNLPSSGYALLQEKMGVIEENIRRSRLFKEREQQLFQVIKKLWNMHHSKSGEKKFNEKAKLQVIYRKPEFPVDPKTEMETIAMENKLLDSGDRATYKKLYPHKSDIEINKLIESRRKDKIEQAKVDAEILAEQQKVLEEYGLDISDLNNKQDKDEPKIGKSGMDNKAKHAEESSKQPKKNGAKKK